MRTLNYWSLNKWMQVEYWVIGKIPNKSYSAFSCNNMSEIYEYQILADRFVLNLKKWKKLKVPFFLLILCYWSRGKKKLSGTLVRIPYWIRPGSTAPKTKIHVITLHIAWFDICGNIHLECRGMQGSEERILWWWKSRAAWWFWSWRHGGHFDRAEPWSIRWPNCWGCNEEHG